jgi:ligand-binding sensor domain-containing protein
MLWVGTTGGGLNRFNVKSKRFELFSHQESDPKSLSNDFVLSIFADITGVLWVGTRGGGLNKFDSTTGQFTRYLGKNQLDGWGNINVWAINQDAAGTLWVGTDGGINKYDAQVDSFTIYQLKDGLANNSVYGILEDGRANLWLSTKLWLSLVE